MAEISAENWMAFYQTNPGAHILQSASWGRLKENFGWQGSWIRYQEMGAQVLFQSLPLGYTIAYLPRGPVVEGGEVPGDQLWKGFLGEVDRVCRSRKAVFLKLEPDLWESERGQTQPWRGFQKSAHGIQPPRTIVVSLQESEEEILGRMKSKTRYNIRLAGRKDVTVRKVEQVKDFYHLLESTADRADFGIHSKDYYHQVFRLFHPEGRCQVFQAEYAGKPLASIMVFLNGQRSWYFYGASSPEHRDRMPTYLVQWEAMRWAKQQGCLEYDLWGVPDVSEEELEDQFLNRSDGLWGVYRFKRGFGGELRRAAGPWDRVYQPGLYRLYRLMVKVRQQSGDSRE